MTTTITPWSLASTTTSGGPLATFTYWAAPTSAGHTAPLSAEPAWRGPWLASHGFVVLGIQTNSRDDFGTAHPNMAHGRPPTALSSGGGTVLQFLSHRPACVRRSSYGNRSPRER
ncbi:hypothetical protein Vqi01_41480 [Micromonospora qiuiae]|uniref:Uncharacterized protein n=1 Tax=Micromonospora qiuiae TaxID=502268 RepID=A0ABQ4JFM7_9ACTN|nr:hypothetical protein [Micromonospora qiuiae]GIJ28986.1 hypothetical protein Vqi01_41480 [Micromonospora qiuiae]